MTALPLEPHTEAEEATLKRIEGAEPAEESAVEKVARAVWPVLVGVRRAYDGCAQCERELAHAREIAAAAIEAMKGPSPAEEALARVEALAEEMAEQAEFLKADAGRASARGEHTYVTFWLGKSDAYSGTSAQLRAAIAAPVAQAGEGR